MKIPNSYIFLIFLVMSIFSESIMSEEAYDVKLNNHIIEFVNADIVNVREYPSNSANILSRLQWGDRVKITGFRNNWARVEVNTSETPGDCGEKFVGWTYAAYFDPCQDDFNIIKESVDNNILKFKVCEIIEDDKKQQFREFFVQFVNAFRNKEFDYLLEHSLATVGMEFGSCECTSLSKIDLATIRNLGSGYFYTPWWMYEYADSDFEYVYDDNGFIRGNHLSGSCRALLDDNHFGELPKTSDSDSGDCYLEYGNNWARVDIVFGTKGSGSIFFIYQDGIWKFSYFVDFSC